MKECYTSAIEILKGFSHSASICLVVFEGMSGWRSRGEAYKINMT